MKKFFILLFILVSLLWCFVKWDLMEVQNEDISNEDIWVNSISNAISNPGSLLGWFWWFWWFWWWWDYLDSAYSTSKSYIVDWDGSDVVWSNSMITRFSKFLLWLSTWLWMIMFLYWWIKVLLTDWDAWNFKKVRDNLMITGLWIMMAFWSWVILNLMQSVTTNSTFNSYWNVSSSFSLWWGWWWSSFLDSWIIQWLRSAFWF